MATLIHHPHTLADWELDDYLANGWRATGQSVYNSNYLLLDSGDMVGVLPSRVALSDFQFSKRMRKRMRNNLRRFQVVYGPAMEVAEDKQNINRQYLARFPNKSLEYLEYHLLGNAGQRVLNTWETRVYDAGKLIAFSYFDLGKTSAYSKAGIYDPDYAKYSLGLFTMGLEIEFCLRLRKQWYYPGYVSDADSSFDYKHRLGQLQYYDITRQSWQDHGTDPVSQRPMRLNVSRLKALGQLLNQQGVVSHVYVYPYLNLRYQEGLGTDLLDAPALLFLSQHGEYQYLVVTYDVAKQAYQLLDTRVSRLFAMRRIGFDQINGLSYFSDPLRVSKVLMTEQKAVGIAEALLVN
ncbi:MAG: hypothetical protein AAF828_08910 [Bacteroidota bacterium]